MSLSLLFQNQPNTGFTGFFQGMEAGKAAAKESTLQQLAQQAMGGDKDALQRMAGIDPETAMNIQQIQANEQTFLEKQMQVEQQKQQRFGRMALDVLNSQNPEIAYRIARREAEIMGADVSQLPEQFTTDLMPALQMYAQRVLPDEQIYGTIAGSQDAFEREINQGQLDVQRGSLGLQREQLGLQRQQMAQNRELAMMEAQAKAQELPELTPAQKKIDEKFAEDYLEWTTRGGASDVQKNLTQLGEVEGMLTGFNSVTGQKARKKDITGIGSSAATTIAPGFFPNSTAARNAVEEVVQRNLRLVLGAQFTEKEGERLIARAYNPELSEEENGKRVSRLVNTISNAANAKAQQVAHYERYGTLVGSNVRVPTISEFEAAIEGGENEGVNVMQGAGQSAPAGVEQKLWDKMTAEEKALWQ